MPVSTAAPWIKAQAAILQHSGTDLKAFLYKFLLSVICINFICFLLLETT